MRLKISLTIILLISCSKLFSQIPQEELMKFYKFSQGIIKRDLFKDSTAFYGFNIQILVDKNKGYIPTITSNNDTLAKKLTGLKSLSEYDYKGLMGSNEYVKFILPVAITIRDTKFNRVIPSYISDSVSYMFYASTKEDDNMKVIYLEPLITDFFTLD